MRVYAQKGETVICEAGHPICDFSCTVFVGDMQDLDNELTNWRQPVPQIGLFPLPVCALCGGQFTDGSRFHFRDGWRT